jgi:hypothetical protein
MTTAPELGPRARALKIHRVTEPQWEALDKFGQAGGHGFGEYAYLPRPTAKVLARRGLVELGRRSLSGSRSIPWGTITDAGRELLAAVKLETETESERRSAGFRARLAELEARARTI